MTTTGDEPPLRQPDKRRRAIVVLPAVMYGALKDAQIVRWLSRGSLRRTEQTLDGLAETLGMLNLDVPQSGIAALRYWGQTGERLSTWMAAADPIHLAPSMNDLQVCEFRAGEVTTDELNRIYADLQETLAGRSAPTFANIGHYGYLHGLDTLPAADVGPGVANGQSAANFVPGSDPDGTYHQLLGELQMALHENDTNSDRRESGLRDVNSLWIWGAGLAPAKKTVPMPPLFSNDPLFRGYWASCSGEIVNWRGSYRNCLAKTSGDFVVVTDDDASVADHLRQLKNMLSSGQLAELALVFRDGLQITINRLSGLRLWRSRSRLFMPER